MVDFKDLKKIDLGKIDVGKVDVRGAIDRIMANRDLVGQIAVIAISVFVMISILSGYFSETAATKNAAALLKANEEVIAKYARLQGRIKAFRAGLDKSLQEDEFTSVIADLAAQHHVRIVQFSPETRTDHPIYTAVGGRLNVRAERYRDLLLFIRGIETAPYALRIDSCTLGRSRSGSAQDTGAKAGGYEGNLTVLSVDIRK